MTKKSDASGLSKDQQRAADALENFVSYLSSPWRMIWANFVAGIFRGLGAVIGASVVIALMVWVLSLFVHMPLIGKYANQIGEQIKTYVDDTNYNDEFDRLGDSLERLEEKLQSPATSNANDNQPTDNQ